MGIRISFSNLIRIGSVLTQQKYSAAALLRSVEPFEQPLSLGTITSYLYLSIVKKTKDLNNFYIHVNIAKEMIILKFIYYIDVSCLMVCYAFPQIVFFQTNKSRIKPSNRTVCSSIYLVVLIGEQKGRWINFSQSTELLFYFLATFCSLCVEVNNLIYFSASRLFRFRLITDYSGRLSKTRPLVVSKCSHDMLQYGLYSVRWKIKKRETNVNNIFIVIIFIRIEYTGIFVIRINLNGITVILYEGMTML